MHTYMNMDHHTHMHMHVHTQETKASPQMTIKPVSFQKKDWIKGVGVRRDVR